MQDRPGRVCYSDSLHGDVATFPVPVLCVSHSPLSPRAKGGSCLDSPFTSPTVNCHLPVWPQGGASVTSASEAQVARVKGLSHHKS